MNRVLHTAALQRWTEGILRYRPCVIIGWLLAAVVCLCYATSTLRLNTDLLSLFPAEAGWRELYTEFRNTFTQYPGELQLRITADTPEQARAQAQAVYYQLPPQLFRNVYYPEVWPFFRRQALLYLDSAALQALTVRLQAARPWLQQLQHNPALQTVLSPSGRDSTVYTRAIAQTLQAHTAGHRLPLPWQKLLLGTGTHDEHIFAQPRQRVERTAILQHLHALQERLHIRLHPTARWLPVQQPPSVPAGIWLLPLLAALAVLRCIALSITTAVTLACGVAATLGCATAIYGELNLISVLSLWLQLGLGAGWAAQYALHYQAGLHIGQTLPVAAASSARVLLPVGLTVALSGFALLGVPHRGFAELGALIGIGALLNLLLCFSLLPALLSCCRLPALPPRRVTPYLLPRSTRRWLVLLALLAGAMVWHRADFAEQRLQASTTAQPLLLIAEHADTARAWARQLRHTPGIRKVETLWDWLPEEQARKTALLQPLAELLTPTAPPPQVHRPPQLQAALERYTAWLQGLPAQARKQALAALHSDLVRDLPATLQALSEALRGQAFTLQELPINVRNRWISSNQHYLVRAWPAAAIDMPALLHRLQMPRLTGIPVLQQAAARATVHALLLALLLIAATTLLLCRLAGHSSTVPVLSAALTILLGTAAWVGSGAAMDYINSAALPLLGISSIACSLQYRCTPPSARHPAHIAIMLSALTGLGCAGGLILSRHAGLSGAGWVLALGLLGILITGSAAIRRKHIWQS